MILILVRSIIVSRRGRAGSDSQAYLFVVSPASDSPSLVFPCPNTALVTEMILLQPLELLQSAQHDIATGLFNLAGEEDLVEDGVDLLRMVSMFSLSNYCLASEDSAPRRTL